MRIHVEFTRDRWSIDPDPALVKIAESTDWIFTSRDTQLPDVLVWTVYFDHGSPFGLVVTRFTVTTLKLPSVAVPIFAGATHQGAVGPVYPALAGDYKYGVKVEDPITQKTLVVQTL